MLKSIKINNINNKILYYEKKIINLKNFKIL